MCSIPPSPASSAWHFGVRRTVTPILVALYCSIPSSFKRSAHIPIMCLKLLTLLTIPSSLFPVSVYLFRFVLSMNPFSQRTCSKPFALLSHHSRKFSTVLTVGISCKTHSWTNSFLFFPLVLIPFVFRSNSKAERFLSFVEVVPSWMSWCRVASLCVAWQHPEWTNMAIFEIHLLCVPNIQCLWEWALKSLLPFNDRFSHCVCK